MAETDIHKVALKIFGFDCLPDKMTEQLGLEPTETGIKGNKYDLGLEHRTVNRTWPWNFWMHQVVVKKNNHWIGDQVDDFLEKVIKPRQQKIKEVISTCDSEFSIVQYLYDGCNPGLHFDNEHLKIISDIGAELDADIYVLSNTKEHE